MSLTLYYHPLSSYCMKALIGLYEHGAAFEPDVVDLGDPGARAAFQEIWPLAKFPVLRDRERDLVLPETTIILEHLDLHHRGAARLIPEDADLALQARLWDRIFDLHLHEQMGKIVTDKIRPADGHDPFGVERARVTLRTAYAIADKQLRNKTWAIGEVFSIADCAAAPALFYASKVEPFGAHANVAAYYARLEARPSFARVLEEAKPYLAMFPG